MTFRDASKILDILLHEPSPHFTVREIVREFDNIDWEKALDRVEYYSTKDAHDLGITENYRRKLNKLRANDLKMLVLPKKTG
jgi:hypothetical protein